MPSATHKIHRLACDLATLDSPTDVATRQRWAFFRGFSTRLQLGLFMGRDTLIDSIDGWVSIRLEVKPLQASGQPPNDATAPVLAKTVEAGFAVPTLPQWEAGTHQHATIDFTAAEMAAAPAGLLWMTLWLVNGANTVPLAVGHCVCLQPGAIAPGVDPVPPDLSTSRRGTVAIGSGAQEGAVAFATAFAAAPVVVPAIVAPDGDGAALGVVLHSVTAAGFSWALTAPAPAAGYALHWFAIGV